MFAQDEAYSVYLDSFFDNNPTPSISWIHDLGKKRHEEAAKALLIESQQATSLEVQHVNPCILRCLTKILTRYFYSLHSALESSPISRIYGKLRGRRTTVFMMVCAFISLSDGKLIPFLAFHDALDVVGVHEALLEEFNAVVGNIRGRRSLDAQVLT